jgi:hypothetical protein
MKSSSPLLSEAAGIDGDITMVGDLFHLFYMSKAQIKHGVSAQINGGLEFEAAHRRGDVSTEAHSVFRRLGTNNYMNLGHLRE